MRAPRFFGLPVFAGLILTTVFAPTWPSLATAAEPGRLYVATNGSDAWSGTLAAANAAKTDGPFATLARAGDEIRKWKKAGKLPQGGVTVIVRGGIHELKKPLALTADDSGTKQSPIVYQAAENEKVIISGGRRVTGFQPVKDAAVLARLDEAARGKVLQADLRALGIAKFGSAGGGGIQLYFQEKPMTLARWPNEGFVKIVDVLKNQPTEIHGTTGDKVGKFVYDGDRPKRWIGEKDPWVHGYWYWDWAEDRHKIASIDPAGRVIAVAPPYHGYGYRKGQWYYALNLLAELDSPGEWQLDRETGILYFWPPAALDEGRATVSALDSLVTLREVNHVTLRGLTFEAARANAITVAGGTGVVMAQCVLRDIGNTAITISGGKANGVEGCEMYSLGAGGIALDGGDRKTLTPSGHWATNNHIHDYALWRRMYHPGILLQGVGQRAANNLIHSAPHCAILFGGNDHLIELNEIHHVCRESNDAGAIYAGRDWTMRGTVIRHNFMHDVTGFENKGCVGVYLDDMFCGVEITGNVFYKVTRAAFIGGGRDVSITNNVFVDCDPALHIDARALNWAASTVPADMTDRLLAMPYKQEPWASRYPKLVGILDDQPAAPKGNVVTGNVCVGGRWDEIFDDAKPFITPKNNLMEPNPGFVDAAKMNFQLRDDSPVYKKLPGFKKIPFEKIGLGR
jgi:hypothetical protein